MTYTTIKQAMAAYLAALTTNLAGNPPDEQHPLRSVTTGDRTADSLPRPFLTMFVKRLQTVDMIARHPITEVGVVLRIATDIVTDDAHEPLLDLMDAVDNAVDDVIANGLIDGAIVTDARDWTIHQTTASRVATAETTTTLIVRRQ